MGRSPSGVLQTAGWIPTGFHSSPFHSPAPLRAPLPNSPNIRLDMTRVVKGLGLTSIRRGTAGRSLATCLALLVAAPTLIEAASPAGNWQGVRELQEGKRIRVVLGNDQTPKPTRVVKGHFSSANHAEVSVMTPDGNTMKFPKDQILQIRARVPYLDRKVGWAGGLSVAAPYTALTGYLGGIAGAIGGFALAVTLSYPLFARIGRTRAVYRAVRGPKAAADQPSEVRADN